MGMAEKDKGESKGNVPCQMTSGSGLSSSSSARGRWEAERTSVANELASSMRGIERDLMVKTPACTYTLRRDASNEASRERDNGGKMESCSAKAV
jgi:hypothetical protein